MLFRVFEHLLEVGYFGVWQIPPELIKGQFMQHFTLLQVLVQENVSIFVAVVAPEGEPGFVRFFLRFLERFLVPLHIVIIVLS